MAAFFIAYAPKEVEINLCREFAMDVFLTINKQKYNILLNERLGIETVSNTVLNRFIEEFNLPKENFMALLAKYNIFMGELSQIITSQKPTYYFCSAVRSFQELYTELTNDPAPAHILHKHLMMDEYAYEEITVKNVCPDSLEFCLGIGRNLIIYAATLYSYFLTKLAPKYTCLNSEDSVDVLLQEYFSKHEAPEFNFSLP